MSQSGDAPLGSRLARRVAPCHAVIFSSLRRERPGDGYERVAARMLELAALQDGYLGVESAREADGFGITVSYWRDRAAAAAWRAVAEHRGAQELGRERFYSHYAVRIARVEEESAFARDPAGDAPQPGAGSDTVTLHGAPEASTAPRDCFRRWMQHADWSNRRVLAALTAAAPLPAGRRLLGHVLQTEWLYHERLRGADPWPQDFWPALDLRACEQLARRNAGLYERLLGDGPDALDERRLQLPVRYRNSAGKEFASSPAELLVHLVLHGSYHRGQIASVLREHGAAPAVVDYIGFSREVG